MYGSQPKLGVWGNVYSQLFVQGRAIRSRPLGYGGVARKSAKVGQGSKVARVPEKSADLSL